LTRREQRAVASRACRPLAPPDDEVPPPELVEVELPDDPEVEPGYGSHADKKATEARPTRCDARKSHARAGLEDEGMADS
jgi:hypothetical protein